MGAGPSRTVPSPHFIDTPGFRTMFPPPWRVDAREVTAVKNESSMSRDPATRITRFLVLFPCSSAPSGAIVLVVIFIPTGTAYGGRFSAFTFTMVMGLPSWLSTNFFPFRSLVALSISCFSIWNSSLSGSSLLALGSLFFTFTFRCYDIDTNI